MVAIVLVAATVCGGCAAGVTPPAPATPTTTGAPTPSPTPAVSPFRAAGPGAPAVVVDVSDPVQAALTTSRTLYSVAPVVVLAASDDTAAQLTAASAAVALGAPLLLTPPAATGTPVGPADPALTAELVRLHAKAVLVVGRTAAPQGLVAVRVPDGADTAALALATDHRLGPATPVPAGAEAAAVSALARPAPAVLSPAAPATAPPGPSGTASPSAVPPVPDRLLLGTPEPQPTSPVLPRTVPPVAVPGTVALTGAGPVPLAVLATVRAAGLAVIDAPAADPRATSSVVQAIARAKPTHVVALGAGFGPADRLAERVAAAATGVELPGGGQLYFPQDEALPGKRYVALYGSPGMPALGVLGEQDVPATIARAQAHAAPYRALTGDTVVAGVEIIATIASAGAGPDGNYSQERPIADLLPLVQAAGAAGMTVVLDLQPGRTDFLTQAQEYEPLLELPYVSLALDPEWRLGPTQVHLQQIGHVGIDEVNAVAAWLAQLVRDHHLPQKALVLHEFALSMVTDRDRLDTSHDELAMVVHVDGQGNQPAKAATWNAIRLGAPAGIHWGWKNFYHEDTPAMLDPAGTYAIQPTPDLVTYQ